MFKRSLRFVSCIAVLILALTGAIAAPSQGEVQQPTAQQSAPVAGLAQGYPVVLEGEEVLRIRKAIGPFTAQERAERASKVLKRIADGPFYTPKLLSVRLTAEGGELHYRDEMIGMATAADTEAFGLPLPEFFADVAMRFETAIERYRERRKPEAMITAVIILVLASAVFVLLLLGVRRLDRRFHARAEAGRSSLLAKRFKDHLGLSPHKLIESQHGVITATRWALTFLLVGVYLQVVFIALPMTRGHAHVVLDYLLNPLRTIGHGILANIGDLFFILAMVALTYYQLKAMRWLAREASVGAVKIPRVTPELALPIYKVLRLVVLVIAAMMIYSYIPGSSTAAFKGIGLFLGALLTFGASGTAGNFIGGIVLVFMGLYRVGDRLRLGEVSGDVVETDLMMTRVRTPKNEIVSIPNSSVLSGQLINYSTRAQQEGLILHTSVTIGYDTPWRQVNQMLLEAARKTPGFLQEPPPFVHQTRLDDFYVTYEVNVYTRSPNKMASLYSELHQNILDEFNRAGVQIMSPNYERDPEHPKLVPLDRWEPKPIEGSSNS